MSTVSTVSTEALTLVGRVREAWGNPGIYAKATAYTHPDGREELNWWIKRPARYGFGESTLRTDGTWDEGNVYFALPIVCATEKEALQLALSLAPGGSRGV